MADERVKVRLRAEVGPVYAPGVLALRRVLAGAEADEATYRRVLLRLDDPHSPECDPGAAALAQARLDVLGPLVLVLHRELSALGYLP